MKKEKLLKKVRQNRKNTRFDEFKILLESFGFTCLRISGSHHIFKREGITEMLNLQNYKGRAKPYQIDQFLSLIEKYGLTPGERS